MNFNTVDNNLILDFLKTDVKNITDNLNYSFDVLHENINDESSNLSISCNLHKLKSAISSVNLTKIRDFINTLEDVFSLAKNKYDSKKILYIKFIEFSVNFINNAIQKSKALNEYIFDEKFYIYLVNTAKYALENNDFSFDINNSVNQVFSNTFSNLENISTSIISDFFENYAHIIAKELDKKVQFHFKCNKDNLSNQLLNKIKTPILYLINNSVVHGIEPIAQRIKSKKSEIGKIYLSIIENKNKLIIKFFDDGIGFDIDKICKKALEIGILNRNKVNDISKREILNYVFLQGFSTYEKKDTLAGEGIGLYTIKQEIESFKGKISIHSKQNRGSYIKIEIPIN
ncbi:hypothetical protein IJG72_04310 [bacterium]|nr:hypothetical protein [bacterium]